MKLHDLKNMQVVEMGRSSQRYLVVKDVYNPQGKYAEYVFISEDGWMGSDSYDENMICGEESNTFTINKVYSRYNAYAGNKHVAPHALNDCLTDGLTLVWERNKLDITDSEEFEEDDKIAESDEFGSKEIVFY